MTFGIDNGELDGLSRQLCFVLGVEWQTVYGLMQTGDPFEKLIHAENQQRIGSMLKAHDRQYRITFMPNDKSESWVSLHVERAKQ